MTCGPRSASVFCRRLTSDFSSLSSAFAAWVPAFCASSGYSVLRKKSETSVLPDSIFASSAFSLGVFRGRAVGFGQQCLVLRAQVGQGNGGLFVSGQIGLDVLLSAGEIDRRGVGIGMIRCAEDDFLQFLFLQQIHHLFRFAEAVGFQQQARPACGRWPTSIARIVPAGFDRGR